MPESTISPSQGLRIWPLNLANFVRYEAKKTHLYSQNLQRTNERKKVSCLHVLNLSEFVDLKLSTTYNSYCIFSTCVSCIPEFKKFFKDEIAKCFFVYLISFHTI